MKKNLLKASTSAARRLNVIAGLTEAYGHEEIKDYVPPPSVTSLDDDEFGDDFDFDPEEYEDLNDPYPDSFPQEMVDLDSVDDLPVTTYEGGDGYDDADVSLENSLSSDEDDLLLDDEDVVSPEKQWLQNEQRKLRSVGRNKIKSVKLTESQFRKLLKK